MDSGYVRKRSIETIGLIVLSVIEFTLKSLGSRAGHQQYVPDVLVFNNATKMFDAVANTPDFSYPIYLDGAKCLPSTLQLCLDGFNPTDTCCRQLLEEETAAPYATVPSSLLYVFLTVVPLGIMIARIWLGYVLKRETRPVVAAIEHIIGALYVFLYTHLITDMIKLIVGCPRPNYYAQRLFSQVFQSTRQKYHNDADVSFPSGHASLSMAICTVLALAFLSDAKVLRKTHAFLSWLLIHIAGACLLLSIWIGCTRITG